MRQSDIDKILEKHAAWLRGEEGGERANLRGVDLRGAHMQYANLRGVDLRGVDLTGADLWRADLWDADLTGANLRGANLRGAHMWDANLRGAIDAPVALQAGPWSVYIQGGYIRIGCKCHTVKEWREFDDEHIAKMDKHAAEWWNHWRTAILALAEAQQSYYPAKGDEE